MVSENLKLGAVGHPKFQCHLFHPLTSKMSAKTSFSVLKAQNEALMGTVILKLTKITLHSSQFLFVPE